MTSTPFQQGDDGNSEQLRTYCSWNKVSLVNDIFEHIASEAEFQEVRASQTRWWLFSTVLWTTSRLYFNWSTVQGSDRPSQDLGVHLWPQVLLPHITFQRFATAQLRVRLRSQNFWFQFSPLILCIFYEVTPIRITSADPKSLLSSFYFATNPISCPSSLQRCTFTIQGEDGPIKDGSPKKRGYCQRRWRREYPKNEEEDERGWTETIRRLEAPDENRA